MAAAALASPAAPAVIVSAAAPDHATAPVQGLGPGFLQGESMNVQAWCLTITNAFPYLDNSSVCRINRTASVSRGHLAEMVRVRRLENIRLSATHLWQELQDLDWPDVSMPGPFSVSVYRYNTLWPGDEKLAGVRPSAALFPSDAPSEGQLDDVQRRPVALKCPAFMEVGGWPELGETYY